ncbi:Outer membrane lipoprotein omp16 precursor [hydrothermal vent metagenome]|uniref:Outer membrane lipoprotein omp16 n=1 Tax=hydrothermal vent metagenome TaxID=652676 RepID=A0A1W1CZ43_9ZZZZ
MQKKLWLATALGALLLSGCAQSAPDLGDDLSAMGGQGQDPIAGDTISIDEMSYGNEDGALNGILGGSGAMGNFNSSADGFKSIYFGFDNYSVAANMQENMAVNIQMANNSASGIIKIEGNCDEFGTDEYNYALGLKRAKAVKDSLIAQGVSASKMSMISFGESTPVCQTAEDSCYEQNRRVDLRVVR